MAYGIVLEFDDSVGKQQCRRRCVSSMSTSPVSTRPEVYFGLFFGWRGSSGGTIGRLPVPSTNAQPK